MSQLGTDLFERQMIGSGLPTRNLTVQLGGGRWSFYLRGYDGQVSRPHVSCFRRDPILRAGSTN